MPHRWRNGQVYNSLAPTPVAAYGGFRGSSEGSQHNATRITSGAATGGAAGAVRAVLTDTAIEEYPKTSVRTSRKRAPPCHFLGRSLISESMPYHVEWKSIVNLGVCMDQEPVSGTASWVAVTPSLRMAHFGQPSILRTLGATPTHQMRRLVSALYSSPERLLSPQPANEGAE
ncbi:hypothetical protein CPLU01_09817 [Colletotrichum plurivorum]|uniref:Uncharacterized protein n=1 Tax=Colletotrichum plurivorum TaxID=2175906 RepID=A0A8H6K773_9PEZI|nr:hypothetical protein CPLU01_09817 [Colletotrichum plurivorum]